MKVFSGAACVACFLGAVFLVIVASPPSKAWTPDPKLGYDQPLANAQFRHQKRVSADGTVPENAWMIAKEARKRLEPIRQLSAGVAPNGWTSVGPTNVGGRIRAVVFHPTTPTTMWIGSSSGGIWKTTDGGATWAPLDDFLPGIAIATIVIDPNNPNILYAGTGEGFFETEEGTTNTACIRGAGIFKTTDGGNNWTQLPATIGPNFYFVNRLSMSPTNSNVLLAACSTGMWRSTDAGTTWTKTLANQWAYDVDFHPADGARAVAGTHQNGVYYTINGGVSWSHSPSIAGHRTEVAYSKTLPLTVFATVSQGGSIRVWRSQDGGISFTLRTANSISTYEAYNNALWVSPTTASTILYGGVYLYRSTDAGSSRSQAFSSIHPDIHAFATHPQYNGTTNKVIYVGTDGGLFRIDDSGGNSSNLSFVSGLGITQFYGASINPVSGRIWGGTQDNGTQLYTGNAAGWTQSAGGDGGYTATDPADQNFFYGTIYWALHFRSTDGGVNADYMYGGPNPITDADNSSMCNFENYLALDPNNSNRMLVCTQRLWRSNNVKAAQPDWFIIKPSIAPQNRGGGGDGAGGDNAHFAPNNPYNISTVAVAPGNSNVIWVGHNNGQVYKTSNGTATNPTWTRVDNAGPLPDRWVSRIAIDPANSNHVYVGFMGWQDDSIWETTNGGASFVDIASGGLIPASVNVIALHPTKPGWIYAGTDLGLFTTSDNGAHWTTDGPGTVSVEDISFRNASTIMIATYGRGIFTAPIDTTTDRFSPNSLNLEHGRYVSGNLGSVQISDDKRFVAQGSGVNVNHAPPVEMELGGLCPIAVPSRLDAIIESSASTGGTRRVRMYNYQTSLYEIVDSRTLTSGDATSTISITANAGRFVGPNRVLKMRVSFEPFGQGVATTGRLDLVEWKVKP